MSEHEYIDANALIDWFSPYGQSDEQIPFETIVEYVKDVAQPANKTSEEIFRNRALPDGGKIQDVTDCENCLEELAFAMQDNHHKFSIGLHTILYCLAIAEKEGFVPRIPAEWWDQVRGYFP